MSTYSFNSNTSGDVESDMLNASNQIITALQDQSDTIDKVLVDWVDGAKDGYQDRKRQWESIAANMPAKLGYVHTTLAQIRENYELTTKQGVNTWEQYSPK